MFGITPEIVGGAVRHILGAVFSAVGATAYLSESDVGIVVGAAGVIGALIWSIIAKRVAAAA